MKRKTPNAQRRTSNAEVKKPRTKSAEWSTVNIECGLHGSRVNDLADSEYGGEEIGVMISKTDYSILR